MRKKIVAGNWKMNLEAHEAMQLADEIMQYCQAEIKNTEVIIFAPSLYLGVLREKDDVPEVSFGGQNIYEKKFGAYTGEINAQMLASASIRYCLVGHSERRLLFEETDEICLLKTKALLEEGITPILCVGESLGARESNEYFEKVTSQIRMVIDDLSDEEIRSLIIAYEPVWAIGTGKTATSTQAEEMHEHIRALLRERIGNSADEITILYGGSCNEKNAHELFACPHVDGGLIGGASLKAETFTAIIAVAEKINILPEE